MADPRSKLRERLSRLTDAQLLELSPLIARERKEAETSLDTFVEMAWPIIESDRPFITTGTSTPSAGTLRPRRQAKSRGSWSACPPAA
jgi:hypothetical protein